MGLGQIFAKMQIPGMSAWGPGCQAVGFMGVIAVMMVVVVMMNMSVSVVMMTPFGKKVADAVNSDVFRPAAAYIAHDYFPPLVLEGSAVSRCPAHCNSPQITSVRYSIASGIGAPWGMKLPK